MENKNDDYKMAFKVARLSHPAMPPETRDILKGLAINTRYGKSYDLYVIDYSVWLKQPTKSLDSVFEYCAAMDKRQRDQYRWLDDAYGKEANDLDSKMEKSVLVEPTLNVGKEDADDHQVIFSKQLFPTSHQFSGMVENAYLLFLVFDGKIYNPQFSVTDCNSLMPQTFEPPIIPQKLIDAAANCTDYQATFTVNGLTLADFGIRKAYVKTELVVETI